MQHYYENPLSVLCLPPGCDADAEIDAIVSEIERAGAVDEYAGLLAELGSGSLSRFLAAAESRPPSKDSDLACLLRLAASLPTYPPPRGRKTDLRPLFSPLVLHLSSLLARLRRSWRALALLASRCGMRLTAEGWLMLLEGTLAGSTWWNRAWGEVGKWDRKNWDGMLADLEGVEGFASKAGELRGELASFDEEEDLRPRAAGWVGTASSRTTSRSLRAREDEEARKAAQGGIEGWRWGAGRWLEGELREGLASPMGWPFGEVVLVDSVGVVEKHFAPPIRACLHTALGKPSPTYLACACCPDDQLRATMGDPQIAYRLHLEHGRMVNLADWAVQFRDVVNGSVERKEEEDGGEEAEWRAKEVHARFVRSASELQFVGLVKRTNRRKDHVVKAQM
ncbi:hypothetical protein DFJ74DRAFT_363658 [Hyaloraphidium curvatum]|nr:hypothetical protein DFJ74DRAFT_363658 [Hyaloraphidium curvatum]